MQMGDHRESLRHGELSSGSFVCIILWQQHLSYISYFHKKKTLTNFCFQTLFPTARKAPWREVWLIKDLWFQRQFRNWEINQLKKEYFVFSAFFSFSSNIDYEDFNAEWWWFQWNCTVWGWTWSWKQTYFWGFVPNTISMGFLLLRWKHWQCEELYTDIDCHLLVAMIMTLTQMTIMRILELRWHIFRCASIS